MKSTVGQWQKQEEAQCRYHQSVKLIYLFSHVVQSTIQTGIKINKSGGVIFTVVYRGPGRVIIYLTPGSLILCP